MAASGKNPKKRNSLAGSTKGTSKSARYFQTHPEARKKKNAKNTVRQASKISKTYRAKLNKANRDNPNSKGQDKSHTKKGTIVNEKTATNRARNGKNGKSKKK